MTTAGHTHEDLATKEDVADYKVAISDVIHTRHENRAPG